MNIRPESRRKFEKQGVLVTQQHLAMDNMDPTEKTEIVEWLSEQEENTKRQETTRYRWMLAFTIIAAAAGSIAACPVIRNWFTK
jgi:hypothetical protein